MTDHANELRRYARKIAHPAGDVPSVMLAAADEIERLAARLEAAEKSDAESLTMYRKARDERDALRNEIACVKEVEFPRKAQAVADAWKGKCKRLEAERDALHAKIEQMEKQEPVGVLHVGSWYGEELQDWEFEADQTACDRLNEAHQHKEASIPLYARSVPAQSVPEGFSREDLEAVADGLDGYEKTVNVGNVTGEGDDHLESTTAYAARFIRTMLALPGAKGE